jgi:transposase
MVDLLPDRSAATVAVWLAKHPPITVVCRDRSALYADGIRRGLPNAVQVVDRFHLVLNLHQALEAFLSNYRSVLQAAAAGTASRSSIRRLIGPARLPGTSAPSSRWCRSSLLCCMGFLACRRG